MGWLILILVLLAAAFGVLGAVLEAVVFVVLTVALSVVLLVTIGWYVLKHKARKLIGEFDARVAGPQTRSRRPDEGELPPARDDRY